MPFGRLFRSRWAAALWAAGVVWTAYDVADVAAPEPATANAAGASDQATADEMNAVSALLNLG